MSLQIAINDGSPSAQGIGAPGRARRGCIILGRNLGRFLSRHRQFTQLVIFFLLPSASRANGMPSHIGHRRSSNLRASISELSSLGELARFVSSLVSKRTARPLIRLITGFACARANLSDSPSSFANVNFFFAKYCRRVLFLFSCFFSCSVYA